MGIAGQLEQLDTVFDVALVGVLVDLDVAQDSLLLAPPVPRLAVEEGSVDPSIELVQIHGVQACLNPVVVRLQAPDGLLALALLIGLTLAQSTRHPFDDIAVQRQALEEAGDPTTYLSPTQVTDVAGGLTKFSYDSNTWRDVEGRLVCGVNDFDEAAGLPYTSDLVRLATSAGLAAAEGHLAINLKEACAAILSGYSSSLQAGGRPMVLAENDRWLRKLVAGRLSDPVNFWARIAQLPTAAARRPAGLAGFAGRLALPIMVA